MKKTKLLFAILFLAFANFTFAQLVLKADDGTTYSIEGTVYFKVVKKDAKGKVLYKVETKIPDKAKGENYYERPAHRRRCDQSGNEYFPLR